MAAVATIPSIQGDVIIKQLEQQQQIDTLVVIMKIWKLW